MTAQEIADALITERDLARWIKRSLGSIRRDRLLRRGVPFVRLGHLIRYRRADVLSYIAAHTEKTEIGWMGEDGNRDYGDRKQMVDDVRRRTGPAGQLG
jgi:hypothetical protein